MAEDRNHPTTDPDRASPGHHDQAKPTDQLRRLIPLGTGIAGILLGIWLAVFIMPGFGLFESSALGRYIDERSLIAARAASEGVRTEVAEQLAALEAQKEIIENLTNPPGLSVTEIVGQYRDAVVTIVTVIPDPVYDGEERHFIGTGFILNRYGMIATNEHVIGGASSISVILADGREYEARKINSDRDSDLAILQIDGEGELPGVVVMGDSDEITVGEPVVAIGSPVSRNFAGTVTSGIISGKDREVYIGDLVIGYLQTDAAINEGNSGGPLFNSRGEVIGINTAKMSENIQGIGLSIPINLLKDKLTALSRPPLYMGFTTRDLNADALEALGLGNGIVVIAVDEASPAELAGIQEQDIILSVDGIMINGAGQLNEVRDRYEAGQSVKVKIRRGTEILTLELRLIPSP